MVEQKSFASIDELRALSRSIKSHISLPIGPIAPEFLIAGTCLYISNNMEVEMELQNGIGAPYIFDSATISPPQEFKEGIK